MFPWSGEEQHEEEPVHPLLETGAFGGDGDTCPSSCAVGRGNGPHRTDGGDVDMKHTVEHPTGLAVYHVDRPLHQPLNGVANGPIIQALPTEIEVVEADYQKDKQPYVYCTTVFRVLAICLYLFEVHGKKFVCENTE